MFFFHGGHLLAKRIRQNHHPLRPFQFCTEPHTPQNGAGPRGDAPMSLVPQPAQPALRFSQDDLALEPYGRAEPSGGRGNLQVARIERQGAAGAARAQAEEEAEELGAAESALEAAGCCTAAETGRGSRYRRYRCCCADDEARPADASQCGVGHGSPSQCWTHGIGRRASMGRLRACLPGPARVGGSGFNWVARRGSCVPRVL